MRNRAVVRTTAAALAIAATLPPVPALADIVPRRDGTKAVYAPADTTRDPVTAHDGFQWDDAAIGAGAVVAAALASAGAFSIRGRRRLGAAG